MNRSKFNMFKRRLLKKPVVRRAYIEAKIRNKQVKDDWPSTYGKNQEYER
jgi:hypothetical protein